MIRGPWLPLGAAFALATASTVACCPARAAEADAEYAIRWSPRDGGPRELADVAASLGIDGRTTTFDVRYFDVPGQADGAILRERTRDGRIRTTWKTRDATRAVASGEDTSTCPLVGHAKRKDEVDVTIVDARTERRTWSASCTADGDVAASLPRSEAARVKGCPSAVTRRESAHGPLTVEAWRVGDGDVFLEVSARRADAAVALADFRAMVVVPLLAAGVRPLADSKTELASRCAR